MWPWMWRDGPAAGSRGCHHGVPGGRDEMPAWDYEVQEALEEKVKIINSRGPVRFIGKFPGRVSGAEFKRCTAVFDENRRFNPQYDPTDLIRLDADHVIIAIGQMASCPLPKKRPLPFLPPEALWRIRSPFRPCHLGLCRRGCILRSQIGGGCRGLRQGSCRKHPSLYPGRRSGKREGKGPLSSKSRMSAMRLPWPGFRPQSFPLRPGRGTSKRSVWGFRNRCAAGGHPVSLLRYLL